MAYDNSEKRFASFDYRNQYGELARFFNIDAGNIYLHTELFAIVAVIVSGIVEWVGHSIFQLTPELTVILGIFAGSALAAFSLWHMGRKMFHTSKRFSTYMYVLVGYSIVGNNHTVITPEEVMDWISHRQAMSR
jgi:hypothetical protein